AYVFCTALSKKYPAQSVSLIFLQFLSCFKKFLCDNPPNASVSPAAVTAPIPPPITVPTPGMAFTAVQSLPFSIVLTRSYYRLWQL
ncbi:MAG: hypothetical protein K2N95_13440, partial [Lachnospiraceae bacterium]|nr:hypothetical protein [Lachnospiraceae bacterium]